MFDIYDTSTYSEIPDAYIVINDEKLYKNSDKKDFVTFKDVTDMILNLERFFQKHDPNFKISKQGIQGFLNRLYLSNSISNFDKHIKIQEEQNNDTSSPKKSDLTIKDYNFTIAQKEMIRHISQKDKEKLVDIINFHFQNKEKHYRLQQEIFDKGINIDNYLFAELCFCKDIEKEHEIMTEYYASFDTLTSKEELEELLNNDYLNLYPELKNDVKIRLMINLGFN